MSKIYLQQERESIKSTLFTEEIENEKNALYILRTNLAKLEDAFDGEDCLDLVNEIKYMHINKSGGFHDFNSCFWYLQILEGVIKNIEKGEGDIYV